MGIAREILKYCRKPGLILPRLETQVSSPLCSFLARAWVWLAGQDRLRKGRKILLFGAFGGRAYGDNAAAFFEHVLPRYPELECYWVIRKDVWMEEVKKANLSLPDSRVALKDSFRANVLALLADVLVYSHGRFDVTDYPRGKLPNTVELMLNHGIIGLKRTRMKPLGHGKSVVEHAGSADFVVSSSEREARIKVEEWGIPAEKILLTGLPRFDRLQELKEKVRPSGDRILYMPTWRDWDTHVVSLRNTALLGQMRSFLVDSGLSRFLREKDIVLQLSVHQRMREFFEDFAREFSLENIEVLDQDIDLQETILRSSLLVTDYSSVCWDFLFLGKPVLFFQFDLENYLELTGAYLDLRKDLFGPVARNAEEAFSWVRRLVETGFSMEAFNGQMERMSGFAFAYRDGKNCERLARELFRRIPCLAGDAARIDPSRGL